MKKLLVSVGCVLLLIPAMTSAAVFCPNLTEDMWLASCEQDVSDPDCARRVSGTQVAQLQRFLMEYFNNPVGLWQSGYYGNKTTQFITEFQSEWDVPNTGRTGPLTRVAIAEACTGTTHTPPASTSSADTSPPADSNSVYTPPFISGLMEPTTASHFWSGDQIRAVHAVNVRSSASLYGTILGTQQSGALGSIVGGPTYADDYVWWNLNWDSGPDGWSVQNFLVETTVNTSRSCILDGLTVAHGGSATFYPVRYSPHECGSLGQTRTCNNGFLSGSDAYYSASCAVGEPPPPSQTCYLDGVTMQNGESRTFYPVRTSPHTCDSLGQLRTCNAGFLSGSDTYFAASCNGTAGTATNPPTTTNDTSTTNANTGGSMCWTPWYTQIPHGTSVTAYSVRTVSYGLSCEPYKETRTCNNGVLSGSYRNEMCRSYGVPCTLDGVTVPDLQSRTFYSASSVQSPNTCAAISQTRTCESGTLSGSSSYNKASCSMTQPPATNSTPGLSAGDRVQAMIDGLNVRSAFSLSGTIVGTQPLGASGTIVGDPAAANGFTWRDVNWDSGPDGWSVENHLAKVTTASAGNQSLNQSQLASALVALESLLMQMLQLLK